MNGETPVSVVDKHKQLSTDFFNASYLEAQSLLLRLYGIVLYGKINSSIEKDKWVKETLSFSLH